MKKMFKIAVDCPVCAGKMEVTAGKTPGVKEATVNFLSLKMWIEFEENVEDHIAVMKEVLANCRKEVDDDVEIFFEYISVHREKSVTTGRKII